MKRAYTLLFAICLASNAMSEDYGTNVTLTCYNAVKSQCNDDPLTTADGTKIIPAQVKSGKQRIVAVSRDLLEELPMGSVVHIDGFGLYEVRDKMNKRYTKRMDILQDSSKKNFKINNVKVKRIKKKK